MLTLALIVFRKRKSPIGTLEIEEWELCYYRSGTTTANHKISFLKVYLPTFIHISIN